MKPERPDAADDGVNLRCATAVAEAVQSRRVRAAYVLEVLADRIHSMNSVLNALVATRLDGARVEAARTDSRLHAGLPVPPWAGVAFTAKDVLATADLPTTCGSRVMKGHRTALDATVVRRLRAAGAILVAKTNCPEFAFGIDTINDLHGRTLNPLGDITPGGSSGGEAAAVASGMSCLGVGTDFGGSVRWPAQCTALVGLRPTVGLVPGTGTLPALADDEPVAPNARSLQGRVQVTGLLGHCVADVATGLRVVAGPDGVDPLGLPVVLAGARVVDLSRLEVRHGHTLAGQQVDPAVVDAVSWAVEALCRGGAATAEGLPSQLATAVGLYSRLRRLETLDEIVRVSVGRTSELTSMVRRLLSSVPSHPPQVVAGLWALRDRLAGELAQWLTGDRLLVLPVAARLPPRSDEVEPLQIDQLELLAMCRAVSLFGLPAISVPCPRSPDGRPVSVQVVGPPFREDLVLTVATYLEQCATAAT